MFSTDRAKIILVTYVHTVNSKDLEKSICWKKKRLIPPSNGGKVKNTTLHQVLFKSYCRHICRFIGPEIISALSFHKAGIVFSMNVWIKVMNRYLHKGFSQSTRQSLPTVIIPTTFSNTFSKYITYRYDSKKQERTRDRSSRLCIIAQCGFMSSICLVGGDETSVAETLWGLELKIITDLSLRVCINNFKSFQSPALTLQFAGVSLQNYVVSEHLCVVNAACADMSKTVWN